MVVLDNRKNIRSFGRINSRGVLKNEQDTLNNILPKYSIDLDFFVDENNKNYLEIGFGYGESICERAKNNKNINYIGCETYIKGVLNLVHLLEENSLKNVKIFNGDARLLLENLPEKSLDFIYILFPDPWPKKKHQKRRIINEDLLNLLAIKMKVDGHLFFATDIENYRDWAVEKVLESGKFKKLFDKKTWENSPEWWVKTKYQQKAINEGRKCYFLEWKMANI